MPTAAGVVHNLLTPRQRNMNFAQKYCTQHNISPEAYEATVLRVTLRPAARVIRPILNLNRDYFAVDRHFIRRVGQLTSLDDFNGEAEDFVQDPRNRDFLHRTLRLRVSRRRLRSLVRETLKGGDN